VSVASTGSLRGEAKWSGQAGGRRRSLPALEAHEAGVDERAQLGEQLGVLEAEAASTGCVGEWGGLAGRTRAAGAGRR